MHRRGPKALGPERDEADARLRYWYEKQGSGQAELENVPGGCDFNRGFAGSHFQRP